LGINDVSFGGQTTIKEISDKNKNKSSILEHQSAKR